MTTVASAQPIPTTTEASKPTSPGRTRAQNGLFTPDPSLGPDAARIEADKARRAAEAGRTDDKVKEGGDSAKAPAQEDGTKSPAKVPVPEDGTKPPAKVPAPEDGTKSPYKPPTVEDVPTGEETPASKEVPTGEETPASEETPAGKEDVDMDDDNISKRPDEQREVIEKVCKADRRDYEGILGVKPKADYQEESQYSKAVHDAFIYRAQHTHPDYCKWDESGRSEQAFERESRVSPWPRFSD